MSAPTANVPASDAPTSAAQQKTWPNTREAYELKDLIGVGATASVYSAMCTSRNELCAIKRINLEKCNTSMDELAHEITAMSQCAHANVVNYFTSFVVEEELWVVMKLLACGSLLDILKHKLKNSDCKHGVLDEVTIATVLKEVLKGLEYFHNNGQIHRDIKAGNILLSADGGIQTADFGVSAWLATGGDMSRQKVRHTFVGTPCWMAPEVMEQVTGYDFKADMWSFGILAIELATGTAPYHKYPPMKVLMLTLQNEPPTIDSSAEEKDQYKGYGKTFRKMIAECLQKEPSKRPTATELLKHAFFKKAKDKRWISHALIETGAGVNLQHRAQQAKRLHRESRLTTHEDQSLVHWAFASSDEEDIQNRKERHVGSSGRFHKTHEGEWVWSEDNESSADELVSDEQTTITSIRAGQEEAVTICPPPPPPPLPQNDDGKKQRPAAQEEGKNEVPSGAGEPASGEGLSLVLRLRNSKHELNDIKFEYTPGEDTVEGVAQELIGAGLIDGKDFVVVAANLHKMLENKDAITSLIFALNSGTEPNELPDEKNLIGFAQLNIA